MICRSRRNRGGGRPRRRAWSADSCKVRRHPFRVVLAAGQDNRIKSPSSIAMAVHETTAHMTKCSDPISKNLLIFVSPPRHRLAATSRKCSQEQKSNELNLSSRCRTTRLLVRPMYVAVGVRNEYTKAWSGPGPRTQRREGAGPPSSITPTIWR